MNIKTLTMESVNAVLKQQYIIDDRNRIIAYELMRELREYYLTINIECDFYDVLSDLGDFWNDPKKMVYALELRLSRFRPTEEPENLNYWPDRPHEIYTTNCGKMEQMK